LCLELSINNGGCDCHRQATRRPAPSPAPRDPSHGLYAKEFVLSRFGFVSLLTLACVCSRSMPGDDLARARMASKMSVSLSHVPSSSLTRLSSQTVSLLPARLLLLCRFL
jgi:hypothetical protein